MNPKTCTIIVYTQNGAVTFELMRPCDDFDKKLADALDQGTVLCDTADGSKLILNAVNVVAVEICAPDEEKKAENTPPVPTYDIP